MELCVLHQARDLGLNLFHYFFFITLMLQLVTCFKLTTGYVYAGFSAAYTCLFKLRMEFYYMEESVLLGIKPLVDSIRHFIRDPSGVFSVCHLCECRIVQ